MTIENIIEMFFEKVPELKDEFNMHLKENLIDKNDGIYVIWGMGVMPCVFNAISNCSTNTNQKTRIFAFFEEMAISDEYIKELLMYSTLEKLGDDKNIYEKSLPLMGKATRNLFNDIQTFLGR